MGGYTFRKAEHLKSEILIKELFSKGSSFHLYPFKVLFLPHPNPEHSVNQVLISVSKRNFKKAVDRNYFKRVLRETYRLNKHLLLDGIDQPYAFMFFYQTKDQLNYEDINTKTVQLFEKFLAQIDKESL